MIENFNATKNSSSENYVETKKYIGVASINVLSVNPSNNTLRMYGWQIPEDAEEPKYVTTNNEGKKSARVRFLAQIQDLSDKPVIALDFWIRPDIQFNKDQTKCQVIDSYGRTAYATKAEVQSHSIPQYSNGPAQIASDYKPAHVGEEALIAFIMKYLNVTPLKTFIKASNSWVDSKNPGRLTIDRWNDLCNGNVNEVKEYLKLQPENRVKVILGIRTTDDNKSFQTFLSSTFISNGARVDITTGEYSSARKAIDRWAEYHSGSSFSATPVKEWSLDATEVVDNSSNENVNTFGGDDFTNNNINDLPFD